jgi:Cys-tRNA(Pro) deacylase
VVTTKEKIPSTAAIRILKSQGIDFRPCIYNYEERGGTRVASRELGIEKHEAIKTIVLEDDRRNPLIVLMHGDREISTKKLARLLGVKTITPCDPRVAMRHTGYMVGGTSPFGTRKPLPVYIEESILDLEKIFINAGRRGLLVEMNVQDLVRILEPRTVNVAY